MVSNDVEDAEPALVGKLIAPVTSVAAAAKEPRDPVAPRQLPTLLGPNLQPLLALEPVADC